MTPARLVGSAAVAIGVALAVAWSSRVPTTYARPGDALLRLSWRAEGVRVEECRRRTAEELQALAPHMRTPEVCVGGAADYELLVELDGAGLVLDTLAAGGARGDRPIYVYRDVDLTPGRHGLYVRFRALVPAAFESSATLDYVFDGEIGADPEEVVLITLDAAATRLVDASS